MLLFNDEDKRELLEEVSIYNVCDFLGIEYQNTGCRKSILCPDHLNHNDQHYGSCFIYENYQLFWDMDQLNHYCKIMMYQKL